MKNPIILNFCKTFLIALLVLIILKTNAQTSVTDFDGNVYNTVTIGTQVWMKENLKTTHYSNGIPIPNVTNNSQWSSLSTGAYCDYDNTLSNSTIYGKLYNFYAVADTHKICPIGWHVPSDGEWNIMEIYLDNTVDTTASGSTGTDIGGKLKELGITHWNTPNTGATNSSGFSALPGGYRFGANGTYSTIGISGNLWTSTNITTYAWFRYIVYNNSQIYHYNYNGLNHKCDGFSVRCIKDESTQSDSACGIQEFNNGFTAPANWLFTGIISTYTSASNSGNAIPSVKFDDSNDIIETAPVTDVSQLSFWLKGVSTDANSALLVEGYNSSSWNTIENIIPVPTTATTKSYNNVSTYSKFRFTYTKSAGNLAFDDVNIICGSTVGINESIENTLVNVFPNPTSNNINIEFKLQSSENVEISLFNSINQQIFSENIKGFSGTYSKTLDLTGASQGVYFLKLKIGENSYTKKVVVIE